MAAEKIWKRYYNEALEPDSEARELYRPLLEILEHMGPEAVAEGRTRANHELRKLGATFNLPGEDKEADGGHILREIGEGASTENLRNSTGIGQHRHDKSGPLDGLAGAAHDGGTVLGEGLRLLARAVPGVHLHPGSKQVPGHRSTHDPGPKHGHHVLAPRHP